MKKDACNGCKKLSASVRCMNEQLLLLQLKLARFDHDDGDDGLEDAFIEGFELKAGEVN